MKEIPPVSPDRQAVLTLSKVLLGAFIVVGISLLFWGAIRAEALLARDDNPRGFEAERRIQRGSILDSEGKLLAANEGPAVRQERRYPLPDAGHIVGYYSMLHGTSGAEAGFDGALRGESAAIWSEWVRRLLHQPQVGRDVKLALDYELQETAVRALNKNSGGALLLEIPRSGENRAWIKALASQPGFDANELDETFEALRTAVDAPLLNRVTQGQYQPGLLLQPFILASALERGIIDMNEVVEDAGRPVRVNGIELRCADSPPEQATWADVLFYRCPGPLQELSDRIGAAGLDVAFADFGLDRNPVLEINTESAPAEATSDPILAGIGQENLSVTPLQIGLAMSALAGNGIIPQAQVGAALEDAGGEWQPWTIDEPTTRAVSAATARAVRGSLPEVEGIYEFSPVILSGPSGSRNAWYAGIMAGEEADYVAVVVLENNASEADALAAGRALLESVGTLE